MHTLVLQSLQANLLVKSLSIPHLIRPFTFYHSLMLTDTCMQVLHMETVHIHTCIHPSIFFMHMYKPWWHNFHAIDCFIFPCTLYLYFFLSEAKQSEVKWSEVKWSEVKWSEVVSLLNNGDKVRQSSLTKHTCDIKRCTSYHIVSYRIVSCYVKWSEAKWSE